MTTPSDSASPSQPPSKLNEATPTPCPTADSNARPTAPKSPSRRAAARGPSIPLAKSSAPSRTTQPNKSGTANTKPPSSNRSAPSKTPTRPPESGAKAGVKQKIARPEPRVLDRYVIPADLRNHMARSIALYERQADETLPTADAICHLIRMRLKPYTLRRIKAIQDLLEPPTPPTQ